METVRLPRRGVNPVPDHPGLTGHRKIRAVRSPFCAAPPHPALRKRIEEELSISRERNSDLAGLLGIAPSPRWPGYNDGMIFPPDSFPPGTPSSAIRAAAAERTPLTGTVRVAVVLVDFEDRAMTTEKEHIENLFFSLNRTIPNGSVREYFREVTNGAVDLVGEVVPVVRMPQPLSWYANGNFGIGKPTGVPRAPVMAKDAVVKSNPLIDFAPYDNDANGYVDAFVVVHAGTGGELSGNPGDIWSHKGVLDAERIVDGVKVFAYLTVPEDAKIGICAHELGHLLFGLPDLYDDDLSSEGIGDWCLMLYGTWGGGGELPVHPSAWCKATQGWVATETITAGQTVTLNDVKSSFRVYRLWTNGDGGQEYFLAENRQRTGYDVSLPGSGLLIWHVDESRLDNKDENHFLVGLVQADNKRDLELKKNQGDPGDPYPGNAGNASFNSSSLPNSHSYAGADTCVSVTEISASSTAMTAKFAVSCGKNVQKDTKDGKDRKDHKEEKEEKDHKDRKDTHKDIGEKESPKEHGKEAEAPPVPGTAADAITSLLGDLHLRLSAVEQAISEGCTETAEPFIGAALRPDLVGGPTYDADAEALREDMEAGNAQAKRSYDAQPPR